ncbi:MAG: FadR/GntR family transcriptional regulator [Egibacteraceae bacterium]
MREIEEQILSGRLRPGDRLAGERQLSEQFGVSRASLREALRVLEALEIVTVRPPTGAGAGTVVMSEPGQAMSSLLRLHVGLRHFALDDVVETRTVIEAWAAGMAAVRADEEHLRRLLEVVEAMSDPDLGPYGYNELDTEFHVGIGEASGNQLAGYLMQALRDAIRRQMMMAFDRLDDWRRVAERLTREHRGVYEAIAAGEGQAAAQALRHHVVGFYREIPEGDDSYGRS